MSNDKHVSRDELLELLGGENESPKFNRIGDHVHECSSCRNKLDALAAQSVMWNKAPELLKSDVSSRMSLSSHGLDTTEHPTESPSSEAKESVWSWPLESILESPRHPEMIGRIGDYDIEREVGHGGMGIVLKAHEAELNRPLAIKVLAPHLASHGPARQRFAQEARSAAGVIHPNVIAVHRVENSGKTPYIVMPYIAGPSLQSLVEQKGPLPEDEIVRMSLQISAGLTAAHTQGLVHRDIKPANMLVADGGNRVLITDFGLARAEDDASLTRTGWLTGTPNYMSPEQTRGDRLDHRSDLFSLGSLIYFLATGRLPFRSETPLGVLNRIQQDQPTPVRQVNRKISKTVSDVIEVLLEKNPEDRFQSAAELHEMLKKQMFYLHQPDTSHPPVIRQKKKLAKPKTSRKFLWSGMAVGGIGLLGLAFSMLPPANAPEPESDKDFAKRTLSQAVQKIEVGDGDIIIANLSDDGSLSFPPMKNDSNEELEYVNVCMDEDQEAKIAFEEAMECLEKKEYEQAKILFSRAAEDEDFKEKSLFNIGCAMALNGEADEAIKQLKVAIDNGFDDYEHFLQDSDLDSLREDERFKNIIAGLKQLNDSRENLWRGIELADQEKYEEAEERIRKALEIEGENERAWLNLGYALHMQKKYDEAMEWHTKAANGTEHNSVGQYNIACVEAIRGNKEAALAALETALEEGLAKNLGLNHVKNDSDLDSLRDEERFDDYVKRFRNEGIKDINSKFCLTDGNMKVSSSHFTGFAETDNWQAEIKGDWVGTIDEDNVDLRVIRTSDESSWSWVFSDEFPRKDFLPPVDRDSLEFKWKKKFGSIVFAGSFEGVNGEGEFKFVGSDSYRESLAKQGIDSAPDALLFRLFFSWEDEEELIKNMKALSGLDLEPKVFGKLLVSGVDAKLVEAYQKAGLDIGNNADFLTWRVEPRMLETYIKSDLDPNEHREFIKQRVEAKLLQQYKAMGLDLEKHEDFIGARVEPQMIKAYVDANLDPDDLEEFIKRRVPAELLKDYSNANFDFEDHLEFISQRVPAKLLKSYRDAELDLSEYEELIRNRVNVEFLKSYEKAGLNPLEFIEPIQKRMNPQEVLKIIEKAKRWKK